MWSFLVPFFTETPEAPLILPDSVQKANLAEAVNKIIHLDVGDMLRSLLSESVWILVKILIALAIYFIGRWIVRRIVRLLDAAFKRRQVDTSLRSFLRNTVKVVFTLILLMIVVQTLGVNVTSLIALFSAATLAIGMALSGTAQNFAGGVMILLMKPYRVGDFISAQGQSGTVREIKLFSTTYLTIPLPRRSSTIIRPPRRAAWTGRSAFRTATTSMRRGGRFSTCWPPTAVC